MTIPKIVKFTFCCWGICCAGLLCGCVAVKHIDRQQYLFDIKTSPVTKTIAPIFNLKIHNTTAIAPADQISFLYRITANEYRTDYYHSFLIAPTQQLTTHLASFIYATKHLRLAPDNNSKYNLYPKLTKLYADYRDTSNPKAVIATHILLTKDAKGDRRVLLDKIYNYAIPIQKKNSESLIAAWNEGITQMLLLASRDIESVLMQRNKRI